MVKVARVHDRRVPILRSIFGVGGDETVTPGEEWSSSNFGIPAGTGVGDLLVWDGTGWAILAAGSDGEMLYADSSELLGLRWDPAPSGSGSGGTDEEGALVFLEGHSASSSATLDFTAWRDDTRFEEYLVEFIAVAPATNATELRMRVSQDGGSTWDSTAGRYYHNSNRATGGTWSTYNGGGSLTALGLAHNVSNGTASLTVTGAVRVYPNGTGQRWVIGQLAYLPDASDRVVSLVTGDYENGAYNGLRFYYSSGNIASGTIRIYGILKTTLGSISLGLLTSTSALYAPTLTQATTLTLPLLEVP